SRTWPRLHPAGLFFAVAVQRSARACAQEALGTALNGRLTKKLIGSAALQFARYNFFSNNNLAKWRIEMTRFFLIACITLAYLPQPSAASSPESSSATSSSSGGVTISGSCSGSCTVHAGGTVTRNGTSVHRENTQVGSGSFSDHAPAP